MSQKNTIDSRAQSELFYGKIRNLRLGQCCRGRHVTKRIYQVSNRYVRRFGYIS